jgi:hypothetical protein
MQINATSRSRLKGQMTSKEIRKRLSIKASTTPSDF